MLNRCPGCGEAVKDSDDVCPYCQRDFNAPVAKKPASQPAAPRRDEPEDEPQLAPSAALEFADLSHQSTSSDDTVPQAGAAKASVIPYALGAAVLLIGVILSQTVFKSKPAPPPTPAQQPVAQAPAPEPEPDLKSAVKEANKEEGAKEEAAPDIPTDQAPPLETNKPPTRRRSAKRRRRQTPPETQVEVTPVYDAYPSQTQTQPQTGGPVPTGGNPNEFRLKGKVFSLLNLQPVSEAEVVLTNLTTGKKYTTETGPDGTYRATLPVSDSGYGLAIRHPGYEPSYIVDESRNFGSLSQPQREEIAQSQARTMGSGDNIFAPGGTLLKRDFALLKSQ